MGCGTASGRATCLARSKSAIRHLPVLSFGIAQKKEPKKRLGSHAQPFLGLGVVYSLVNNSFRVGFSQWLLVASNRGAVQLESVAAVHLVHSVLTDPAGLWLFRYLFFEGKRCPVLLQSPPSPENNPPSPSGHARGHRS